MKYRNILRLSITIICCCLTMLSSGSCRNLNRVSNQTFSAVCPDGCVVFDKYSLDHGGLFDAEQTLQFVPEKEPRFGEIQPYLRLEYRQVSEEPDPDIPVYVMDESLCISFSSNGIDWTLLPHMSFNHADVLISGTNDKDGGTFTGCALAFPGADTESDLEVIQNILKSVRLNR